MAERPMVEEFPNPWGAERGDLPITVAVLHAMGEWIVTDDGAARRYGPAHLRDVLRLSAHAFISPAGVVMRSVPVTRIAWHARGFNSKSVGCEWLVEGEWTYDEFTQAMRDGAARFNARQYQSGGWWYAAGWREGVEDRYPALTLRDIRTHAELAPGRKLDPGRAFDMQQFTYWFLAYGGTR